MPYAEARKLVAHPVACIDCHDPTTMQLRVTRPGLHRGHPRAEGVAGRRRLRRERDGDAPGDAHFVCGQCHVEYYFKGPEKRLDYPWAKGLKVDEHPRLLRRGRATRTGCTRRPARRVLKAQHPEFEMWNQGIHARSGVACADCHMPYKRVGAHEDQRPPRAQPAAQHQPRLPDLPQVAGGGAAGARRDRSRSATVRAAQPGDGRARRADRRHQGGARPPGAHGRRARRARASCSGKAQFYLDFVEAENSTGFHAPQEAARILGESIDLSRQGQVSLRPLPAAKASRATD